jgi:hypothetical protein
MNSFTKNLLVLSILFSVNKTTNIVHAQNNSPADRCRVTVARILSSGDQRHSKGSLLCSQDQIEPIVGNQPLLICHESHKLLRGVRANL